MNELLGVHVVRHNRGPLQYPIVSELRSARNLVLGRRVSNQFLIRNYIFYVVYG